MKDWTGGSYLLIESDPRVQGYRPIVAIGDKYNSWEILGFIATRGLVVLFQVTPFYFVALIFF